MQGIWTIIATVGGGLGLFLLGMRHLSDGLQAASGRGLGRFMSLATGRRIAGVATGIAATLVVQSSSIVAVVLVGFVTSRLMKLSEAITVLIGANIGTTFTVWLMAFAPSPETLGLSAFTLGALMYFPVRRGKVRHAGLALVGLGLVFLGMSIMKEGIEPIRESERISAALKCLDAKDLPHVALVALISAVFTAVIQSSAAAIVIFMTFASAGLITYETAVSALFGANIGTTVTGWIASIGGTRVAKRTALANTLMNLGGSVILLPFVLPVIVPAGKALFAGSIASANVMLPIAATDTVFSLLRGVMFFPLVGRLERLLERLVPEKEDERVHLSSLNALAKASPTIAISQALEEVRFMAKSVAEMMDGLRLIVSQDRSDGGEAKLLAREELLDGIQRDVTVFIGELLPRRMSSEMANLAKDAMKLTDELESASDALAAVARAVARVRAGGERLSGGDLAAILGIHDAAAELMATCISQQGARMSQAKELKGKIVMARELQLLRIGSGSSAVSVLAALDILNAYERLRTHALAIAFISHILNEK